MENFLIFEKLIKSQAPIGSQLGLTALVSFTILEKFGR